MNETLKTVIKHCLTGIDGESYDVGRILAVVGVFSFIAYGGWHVYSNHIFDAMSYGTGLGAALGGAGIGIGAKKGAEPPARS